MANPLPEFQQLTQSVQRPNARQSYSSQLALLGSNGALKNLNGGLVEKDIWGQTFRLFMGIEDSSTGVDEVQVSASGFSRAVIAEPYVNRCITYRGNAIASIPLRVYQLGPDGKPIKAVDHDALRLLDETNPQEIDWISTAPQLMQYSLGSIDTHGHFAWQVAKSKSGRPTEIYFLLPTQYELKRDAKTAWSGLKISRKSGDDGGDRIDIIPRENVVYVANFSLIDPLLGTSRIEVLKDMIDLILYAYQSNKSYFKNSQRPDWVLSGKFANTEDNINRIRRTLRKWLTGENNRSPLILGDEAKATLLTTATKDMEWLNQIRVGSEIISMCFGIPVPIVNNFERSTYENLQAARIAFWSDNFIPEIDGFTQKLTRAYLRKFWPETARQRLAFGYDYSKIEGISEDIAKAWTRIKDMWVAVDESVKTYQILPDEARIIKAELLSQAGLSNQMLKGDLPKGVGKTFYSPYLDTPVEEHSTQAVIDVMAARGTNPQLIENVPGAPNAGDNASKPPPLAAPAPGQPQPAKPPASPPAKAVDLEDIRVVIRQEMARKVTPRVVQKGPHPIPIRNARLAKPQATLTRGLKRMFQDQKNDALRNLRAVTAASAKPEVAIKDVNPHDSLWDQEAYRRRLQDLVQSGIIDAAEAAYLAAAEEYSLAVNFDPAHSRIQQYIGKRLPLIEGIDDTTRQAVADALTDGVQAGESMSQLANRVSAVFTDAIDNRAETIARTETIQAYGAASLQSYADAGIEKAQMYDGDDDPECAAVNGQVVNLDEAEGLMADEHPNGTRGVAPIVDLQEAVAASAKPKPVAKVEPPKETRSIAAGITWES